MTLFDERKRRILDALESDEPDLSPKGRPDDEILELLRVINSHEDYVSTSSCSGRAVVFLDAAKARQDEEGKGRWLMNRHSPFDKEFETDPIENLYAILFSNMKVDEERDPNGQCPRLATLKFEPLVTALL
jgi:tRNA wybutosine-synthesizing protein 3